MCAISLEVDAVTVQALHSYPPHAALFGGVLEQRGR